MSDTPTSSSNLFVDVPAPTSQPATVLEEDTQDTGVNDEAMEDVEGAEVEGGDVTQAEAGAEEESEPAINAMSFLEYVTIFSVSCIMLILLSIILKLGQFR